MESLIKNVFMLLAGCVAGVILYLGLFGWGNTGFMSAPDKSIESATYKTGTSEYKGVLHYAVYEVEKAISDYYLKYCFEPNLFKEWDNDFDLGLYNLAYGCTQGHTYLGQYCLYNNGAINYFNEAHSYGKTDFNTFEKLLKDSYRHDSIDSGGNPFFEHYSSGWF